MKKIKYGFLILILILIIPKSVFAFEKEFSPKPTTDYAKEFISKSEKQQWFLNEVERILNQQGKSINTINSKKDFKFIISLGIYDKNIDGKIPKSIGELYNLKYIFFGKNNLTGEIPEELYNLTNLENLDLSKNNISGSISENIKNLTNLKILLLNSNKLSNKISNSISNLKNLINIDLSFNELTGEIPTGFGNNENLLLFSVSNNLLIGEIPEDFSNLVNLKTLYLWNNEFSGELSENLAGAINLENLDLSQNKLTGTTKEIFDTMENLKLLDISENLFVGDISETLLEKNNDIDNTDFKFYVSSNYMSGENISEVLENQDNFIDLDSENQNKLSVKNNVRILSGKSFSIYDIIETVDATTEEITREKIELDDRYIEIRIAEESLGYYGNKVTIVRDGNGKITIKSNVETRKDKPLYIEILIKDNIDSLYSIAKFQLEIYFNSSTIVRPVAPTIKEEAPEIIINEEIPLSPINIPDNKKLIKYINGYEDGTFKPDGNITREEVAMIIYKLYYDNKKTVFPENYVDINSDRWSFGAINFVVNENIMIGYGNKTFKPENNLTRAEFTVIVSKLKGLSLTEDTFFSDGKTHWGSKFINAVNKAKLMKGYPDGYFRPDKEITRAEVVVVINKVLERDIARGEDNTIKNPFTDLDKSHWAYDDILDASTNKEAVNSDKE